MEPTRDPLVFYTFVSFFPQLVAGPIERGVRLIPQFASVRTFDSSKAIDGLKQMLWGFFKKIVIADNCAQSVNLIFSNYSKYTGSTLLVGAILFAFQIYCDFSGYSDIAIGTARLFGFDLMQNFAFPYFSRDIAEFWRRWHISLSTWFRDYIYIPLGGSRTGTLQKIRNTFIVFVVSGLWHGANWTFIAWGFLHALYFIPLLLFNVNRKNIISIDENRLFPKIGDLFSMLSTLFLVVISWVFFPL
jgi:alginate O-acetyltransferase complex protein AlgI